jgi:CHAT domain-containing protein/tetratricopeptide (TPR) repeat protein
VPRGSIPLYAAALLVLQLPVFGSEVPDTETFLREQVRLELSGDPTRAREEAERAREAYHRMADRRGEAACATLIATYHEASGDHGRYVAGLEEALELLVEADDRFAAAAVARLLSQSEALQDGEVAKGIDLARRALDWIEELRQAGGPIDYEWYSLYHAFLDLPFDYPRLVGFRPGPVEPVLGIAESAVRGSLGAALLWSGEVAEGRKELEASRDLAGAYGRAPRDDLLALLGVALQVEEDLDQARSVFSQVYAQVGGDACWRAKEEDFKTCFFALERLGTLEADRGHFEEALDWNDRGLAVMRRRGRDDRVVDLLRERMLILRRSGDRGAAQAAMDEGMKIAQRLGDPRREAHFVYEQATDAFLAGDWEGAGRFLERALARLEGQGLGCADPPLDLLLGLTYLEMGADETARRVIRQALERFAEQHCANTLLGTDMVVNTFEQMLSPGTGRWSDDSSEGRLGWSQWQREILQAYHEIGAGADAAAIAARLESLSLRPSAGPSTDETSRHLMLGALRYQEADWAGARAEFETALADGGLARSPSNEISVFVGLRDTEWRLGHRQAAIEWGRLALERFEQQVEHVDLDEVLTTLLGERSSVYENQVGMLAEEGLVAESFSVAERARARGIGRLIAGAVAEERPGPDPAPPSAEHELLRARVRQAEHDLELSSDDQETGGLQAGLAVARSELADLFLREKLRRPGGGHVEVAPIKVEQLQQTLDSDTTLLSYFVLEEHTLLYVVQRDTVRLIKLPIGRTDLRQTVAAFRSAIVSSRAASKTGRDARGVRVLPGSAGSWRKLSSDLYRQLLSPVEEFLNRPRLIVIPHDALHVLPFAALRDPAGHYLVERVTLSLAPSGTVLQSLRQRVENPPAAPLILGDPHGAPAALPALPGARLEARAAGRLLKTRPLVGASATETLLRERAGGTGILHLAAHAVHLPESPLFSYVALAPDASNDGRLEMIEILEEIRMAPGALVFLSACETGLGRRTGGDEMLGLVRAFLAAGAGAVIGTLWRVEDSSSAGLAESFYRRLRLGTPAAQALQGAQLEVLHQSSTTQPYFWAGYALIGKPELIWPDG